MKSFNKRVIQPRGLILGKFWELVDYLDSMTRYVESAFVPIGYDILLGRIVGIPLWDDTGARHTVVVGPTGRGKTSLAALVAVLSSLLHNATVVAVDPKGDLWSLLSWSGLAVHVEVESSRDAAYLASRILRALGESVGGIVVVDIRYLSEGEKYLHLETALSDAFSLLQGVGRRSLLIVDEFWRVKESYVVRKIVREGRSSGISLMLVSQQPEDFGPDVWSNSSNSVVFGSHDETYLESIKRLSGMASQDVSFIRRLGVGEALVQYHGSRRALPVRVLQAPITVKNPGVGGTGSWGRVRYGQAADSAAQR
ncbi:hypothetical protein CF15_06325 [Pyrodictium occultum]|uniref:AAA+ ATPase domain-containing protein n=1 Tax=Pyrodictium occultum TaxID=2309 RepID=A0A0V8RWD3_PYROC|nr:hypothetical protein CF15_06325 [Pyrodictium occultum]